MLDQFEDGSVLENLTRTAHDRNNSLSFVAYTLSQAVMMMIIMISLLIYPYFFYLLDFNLALW